MFLKKQKEKIELPDYRERQIISPNELMDLAQAVLEKIKEQIGTETIYIVHEDYNHKYEVIETQVNNLVFNTEQYDAKYVNQFSLKKGRAFFYSYKATDIFKDKEMAQKRCDFLNIEYIKGNIKKLKEEIDKINPIKVMEELENKRAELLKKYEEEQKKLKDILNSQGIIETETVQ